MSGADRPVGQCATDVMKIQRLNNFTFFQHFDTLEKYGGLLWNGDLRIPLLFHTNNGSPFMINTFH